jgi:hypothetical protein
MKGVNDICLNYSVDGTNRDLLKEDKALTHCANSGFWQTGYYDASEDRKWTWADINNLRVKLRAHQAGNRQLGRVVSVFAVIRCLTLQKCAPSLLARVTSTKCEKLRVNAGLAQTDGKASASDSFILPVNQQACIPPTRTPTPLPGITPLPTPVPGPKSVPPETIGLSCLQTSPEPFRRGGVFIYFCLKMDADIVVEVSKLNGEVARTLPSVTCRSGNSQMFFNAVDSADRPLAPGGYIYTIKAITTDGKYVTSHHASFTRGQDLSAGR